MRFHAIWIMKKNTIWNTIERLFLKWKLYENTFIIFKYACNDRKRILIFTFFYVSRRKYWFRANIRFLVFDGLTRFGMSWTRIDYFSKKSVYVCDINFVASAARELMNRISWNLILVSPQHKLVSFNFWWKSFNRWRYNQTFSEFFGMRRSQLLFDETAQKFIYKI